MKPKDIMPALSVNPVFCARRLLPHSEQRTIGKHGLLAPLRRACLTYEGALRRKIRLDLLSWGDLRRNAQALIEAHSDEQDTSLLQ